MSAGTIGDGRLGERTLAALGVLLFHLLLGYVLVSGFAYRVAERIGADLKTFDVRPVPPPPPIEEPRQSDGAPEGEAAPPNLRSRPTPVIAPEPEVRLQLPPPIVSAPLPLPVTGSDPSAGAADTAGPGTGAGGQGAGSGAGGQGTGTGAGGAGRAHRVQGSIENRDYPRAALRARAEGIVSVRYTVTADGRATGCTVTRSSGHAELDTTTCRLVERRFRYRPARNAQGQPVAQTVNTSFDWSVPARD